MFFASQVREVISTLGSKCLFCEKRIKTGEKRVEVVRRGKIVAVFCSLDCQQEKEAELMEDFSKERENL